MIRHDNVSKSTHHELFIVLYESESLELIYLFFKDLRVQDYTVPDYTVFALMEYTGRYEMEDDLFLAPP